MMVVDEEGRKPPTSAAGSSASVVLPQSHAQTAKKAMTGIVTLDERPSTPSVRLTALTQPTMTNIAKIR